MAQLKDDAFEIDDNGIQISGLTGLHTVETVADATLKPILRLKVCIYLVACIAHNASPRVLDESVIFQIALM